MTREKIILSVAVVLCVALSGCGQAEPTVSDEPSTEEPSTVQASEVARSVPVEESDDYADISAIFQEIDSGWSVKVQNRGRRLEVDLTSDAPSPDTEPENWADVLEALEQAMADCEPLAEEQGFVTLSAQLQTADGTILASGHAGTVEYDKFEPVSTSTSSNPPTISKFEYDQITVGMTLSQVVDIIGGSGSLESETGTAGVTSVIMTYQWAGDNGGYAYVLFDDYVVYSKGEYGLD